MRKADLVEMFRGTNWRRNVAKDSISADFRMDGELMNSICEQVKLFFNVGIEAHTHGDRTTITFTGEHTLKELARQGFDNFPGASDYISPSTQV